MILIKHQQDINIELVWHPSKVKVIFNFDSKNINLYNKLETNL